MNQSEIAQQLVRSTLAQTFIQLAVVNNWTVNEVIDQFKLAGIGLYWFGKFYPESDILSNEELAYQTDLWEQPIFEEIANKLAQKRAITVEYVIVQIGPISL